MRFKECLFVVSATLVLACGPSVSDSGFGDGGLDPLCGSGCPDDQVCVTDLGCRDCYPGFLQCTGTNDQEVHVCNDDGNGTTFVEDCDGQVCFNGACLTACEKAEQEPSNVGCHFYAVELDNEAVVTLGIENDAAKQQFSIAVANVNDYMTTVRVYKNTARVGAAPGGNHPGAQRTEQRRGKSEPVSGPSPQFSREKNVQRRRGC